MIIPRHRLRKLRKSHPQLAWLAGGFNILLPVLLVALMVNQFLEDRLRGYSIDLLQLLSHSIPVNDAQTVPSDVVLVLLDEASYASPELAGTPRVLWTPEIAEVIAALFEGGARVAGMDLILPTTAANWTGDKGHDRPFLKTLAKYGRKQGRLVLGEVYLENSRITPFKAFSYAVGGQNNIRPLNVSPDADNVIRAVPAQVTARNIEGEVIAIPSFAREIAHRAAAVPIEGQAEWTVNFDPVRPLESHSFVRLLRCARTGQADFFRQQFEGRVVLLGLDLAVEDRVQSSNRFMKSDNALAVPDCMGDVQARTESLFGTAGVVVLGNAVSNILSGRDIVFPPDWLALSLLIGMAFLSVMIGLKQQHWRGLAALLGLYVIWLALAVILRSELLLVLPMVQALAASLFTFIGAVIYRNLVLDRQRAKISHLFSHYLDPLVIRKMADEGSRPSLGGETRELTMLFSDIEAFSRISEGASPEIMVQFLNRYFKTFETILKENQGIVERFVGDALVGMFSAPITDPDHAYHAVLTALKAREALRSIGPEILGQHVRTRFGVNSDVMTVGNVGAENRVTYTAMGDGANLAARLESANKHLGTAILVGENCYALCNESFEWLFVNVIQVVGRGQPLAVYQPLALKGQITEDQKDYRSAYDLMRDAFLAGQTDQALSQRQDPLLREDPIAEALENYIRQEMISGREPGQVMRLDRK